MTRMASEGAAELHCDYQFQAHNWDEEQQEVGCRVGEVVVYEKEVGIMFSNHRRPLYQQVAPLNLSRFECPFQLGK